MKTRIKEIKYSYGTGYVAQHRWFFMWLNIPWKYGRGMYLSFGTKEEAEQEVLRFRKLEEKAKAVKYHYEKT